MKVLLNRLVFREQVLVTAFVMFVALFWISKAVGRSGRVSQAARMLQARSAEQAVWMENRAQIEAKAARVTQVLSPGRTLNANQLFSEVSRLGQGLAFEVGDQHSERSGDISIHSVQVQVRKIDMLGLGRFYSSLSALAPYVGLELCEIDEDHSETGKINVNLKIYSIELPKAGAGGPKS